MPRAYAPRLSTVHLAARIKALPGIESVRILPPQTNRPRTLLRITTEGRDGWGNPIYSDFNLTEARAWLSRELETPLERMQREERDGLEGTHTHATAGKGN